MTFGDGQEERLDAALLVMKLAADPSVRARREAYEAKVQAAREQARQMTQAQIIDALMARTPGYIRAMLEAEDALGDGALVERYARTFWNT